MFCGRVPLQREYSIRRRDDVTTKTNMGGFGDFDHLPTVAINYVIQINVPRNVLAGPMSHTGSASCTQLKKKKKITYLEVSGTDIHSVQWSVVPTRGKSLWAIRSSLKKKERRRRRMIMIIIN